MSDSLSAFAGRLMVRCGEPDHDTPWLPAFLCVECNGGKQLDEALLEVLAKARDMGEWQGRVELIEELRHALDIADDERRLKHQKEEEP